MIGALFLVGGGLLVAGLLKRAKETGVLSGPALVGQAAPAGTSTVGSRPDAPGPSPIVAASNEIVGGQFESVSVFNPGAPMGPTGGTGGSSGGTGGAGSGTGGTGGGQSFGCFTGGTRVLTEKGYVRFEELPKVVVVVNDHGSFTADHLVHEGMNTEVIQIGPSGEVTLDHYILNDGKFRPAVEVLGRLKIRKFSGALHNLHLRHAAPHQQHYFVEEGWVAHNLKKVL